MDVLGEGVLVGQGDIITRWDLDGRCRRLLKREMKMGWPRLDRVLVVRFLCRRRNNE